MVLTHCKTLLGDPRTPWFWMLLALFLGLPTLSLGLVADDWLHRLAMQGRWPLDAHRGPIFELFNFIPGPGERRSFMDEIGVVPWWADPEMQGAFFRPISAGTHWLDYQLWPDQVWVHHLHSVLWYVGSVGIVSIFFRVLGLSLPVAGLAGLLFALEDSHAFALSWLANRNASVCMVFGVACLLAHRRWRLGGRPVVGLLSLSLFLLSLLSAEAGIGTLAYLVAWQWAMEDGRLHRRLGALIPYLLLMVIWRLVYQHMDYGVLWSELYIDPGRQPFRFGMALIERLPQFMMAQWFQVPIDGVLLLPRWAQTLVTGACWLGSFALIRWLWPLIKSRRDAQFWACGMVLSLIPICASFPMDRVLTFTGLGAFALLALKIEDWLNGEAILSGVERLFLILHVPFALLGLLARPFLWSGLWAMMTPANVTTELEEGDVFILLHSHDLGGGYISIQSLVERELDVPQEVVMLGPGMTDTRVIRLDEHTLELRPEGGWMPVMLSRIYRSSSRPHYVGQIVSRPDYFVEIVEVTSDGRPLVARFVFQESLESPHYRWFAYKEGSLTEVSTPQLGDELTLPSVLPWP